VLIEVGGWSPAMIILDAMEKTAGVRILQAELNDQPGVCLKLVGPLGDIEAAAGAAQDTARRLEVEIVSDVIPGPDPESRLAYESAADYNPLVEQFVVHIPPASTGSEEGVMKEQAGFAVGFIETQGFTAVFEAIDTAVKTAAVEVLAREKLGGGYITVVIKGDVAAVRAAIDAGAAKVNGLGRLIAAHVIPSPSQGVLSLLPEVRK
jgi:carbon dioxide concentrating mechanism protein CcmO